MVRKFRIGCLLAGTAILIGCAGGGGRVIVPFASVEVGGSFFSSSGVTQADAVSSSVSVLTKTGLVTARVPTGYLVKRGQTVTVLRTGSAFLGASYPTGTVLQLNGENSGIQVSTISGALAENMVLPQGRYIFETTDAVVGGRGGLIPIVRVRVVAGVNGAGASEFPISTEGNLPSSTESLNGAYMTFRFNSVAEGKRVTFSLVHSGGVVTQSKTVTDGITTFSDLATTDSPVTNISLISLVIG